jgi:hypothetical protein
MTVQQKKKVLKRIGGLSEGAKKLLHMWTLIAKRNLDPDGDHYELEHMFDESSKEQSLFDEDAEFEEEEEEEIEELSKQPSSGSKTEDKGTGSKSQPSSNEISAILLSQEDDGLGEGGESKESDIY